MINNYIDSENVMVHGPTQAIFKRSTTEIVKYQGQEFH